MVSTYFSLSFSLSFDSLLEFLRASEFHGKFNPGGISDNSVLPVTPREESGDSLLDITHVREKNCMKISYTDTHTHVLCWTVPIFMHI